MSIDIRHAAIGDTIRWKGRTETIQDVLPPHKGVMYVLVRHGWIQISLTKKTSNHA